MRSALIPDPVAREALRLECEQDLSVWLAANGAAVRIPFPTPRNHAEEIANIMALREEERRNAKT